jgi:hypothetical protein
MILRTLKILDFDLTYEKILTNKEFKNIIDDLILKYKNNEEYDYMKDLINFIKIFIDKKYVFNIRDETIYKTIKDYMKLILSHINVNICYVDQKNTINNNDKIIIRINNDFRTERPENIFIKKEDVIKGSGRNVFINKTTKKRVYEYNKNYYSYKDFKLTQKCRELTEEIDENNKNLKKPLIKSFKDYNNNIEELNLKLLEEDNKIIIDKIMYVEKTEDDNKIEKLVDEEDEDDEVEEMDEYEII